MQSITGLMLSITKHKTASNRKVILNKSYSTVDTPEKIKVELYQHQKTLVKAMLDIENSRVLVCSNDGLDRSQRDVTKTDPIVETSAILLSEGFGSGKTLVMLSLVAAQPVPVAYPQIMNVLTAGIDVGYRHTQRNINSQFVTEITRTFTGKDSLIRPNLIVVGSSVVDQWTKAIEEFTDLKCLIIKDYYGLVDFYRLFNARKINSYDIVLLKGGKVTGNMSVFNLPEKAKLSDYQSLNNVVGMITATKCWPRIFYDDFDTNPSPPGTYELNTLFTVFVSATEKDNYGYYRTPENHFSSILEGIRGIRVPLSRIITDDVLFARCNVGNDPKFTEDSIQIPIIQGYKYVYANPDDNYLRLLGAMGMDDASRIMEMCNAGAFETAADDLDIKENSMAGIFQKVLGDQHEKFMHDKYVLDTIEKFRAAYANLPPHSEGKRHSATEIETMRNSIIKQNVPNVTFYSEELGYLADDLQAYWTAAKERDGIAINRVMDNIKEGECQVCRLPLEDCDTFIVKCCGLIVCDICGIKGNQIAYKWSYKLKMSTLLGSCANCKAEIDPRNDLIFLNKEFDMESILNAKGDEVVEPTVIEEVVEAVVEEKTDEIKNPKLKALLAICKGEIPEARESIKINIPHLLQGRIDIPIKENTSPKVLVFANYNETLSTIEEFLVEQKVSFLRLGGSSSQIADTVQKFHTYGTVLLINSQQHCAGLDLQHCSTDLVYYHKIMDKNLESQVCGRIQRIGRKFNSRVHYLCYKNESNMIK